MKCGVVVVVVWVDWLVVVVVIECNVVECVCGEECVLVVWVMVVEVDLVVV